LLQYFSTGSFAWQNKKFCRVRFLVGHDFIVTTATHEKECGLLDKISAGRVAVWLPQVGIEVDADTCGAALSR
jgi:hypothetical protein